MLDNSSQELVEEEVQATTTEEIVQEPVQVDLQSRSEELKAALEQIIEKNSRPLEDGEERDDQAENITAIAKGPKRRYRTAAHSQCGRLGQAG